MTETLTTLSACLYEAKGAAKQAAAWAEAVDLFPHNGKVAKTFAANAKVAAERAQHAAASAARLTPDPSRAKSERTLNVLADYERTREYASQAAESAAYASVNAKASWRLRPATGDLADLCKTRQQAVFAWLSCPEDKPVKLAVLRARVEEAETAIQAALPMPATA